MAKKKDVPALPDEEVAGRIFFIRGHKVMLDRDLAVLYEVTTGNLNKAVARNLERFPEDFMFSLTAEEYRTLRFQSGILKRGQHAKYLPHAFTEHGVAMLSSVLRSARAVQVNIQIIRIFTKLRTLLAEHADLRKKIEDMETRYDKHFRAVFLTLQKLLESKEDDEKKPKARIGFDRK